MITSLCLSLALADVLDVDPVAGPFFEIRDAVTAAAPGDVIRVRAGVYGYFTVQAKSLDIAAYPSGASVAVDGTVRIQGLGPSDFVSISGIEARAPDAPGGNFEEALVIGANAGGVHLEDCRFVGDSGQGARVVASADVALVDCVVVGGGFSSFPGTFVPATALAVSGSRIRLEETRVTALDVIGEANSGADAVHLAGSSLSMLGGAAAGSDGGEGDCCCLGSSGIGPGAGGDGIHAVNSTVEWLGASLSGGAAGFANLCAPSPAGLPIRSINSSVTALQGSLPRLALDSDIVTERAPITVTLRADIGEVLILAVGIESADRSLPGASGSLAIGGGAGVVRRVVFAPAGAVQSLTFPAPEVPPFETMAWWFQSIRLDPAGALQFGVHRRLIVLDDRW